jgi:hypothetical protein
MKDFDPEPREPEQNLPFMSEQNPPLAPEQAQPLDWQGTDEPTDLFQSWAQPEAVAPARIPHLGHLCLLVALTLLGLLCASLLVMAATHFHLLGGFSAKQAATNIRYMLGEEAAIYLVTLLLSLIIFPLFWQRNFFVGIHWRGVTALRLGWRLPAISLGCFALAALDETLLPGPPNAPIEEIFRTPGAAWLMFGFAITLAPFFEEIAFRGFLLPALATACDWIAERYTGEPPRPLDQNGHPQWSIPAMVIASIATSLPFALVHAEQQGHALGPFLLLIAVSLVLCAVRLFTRSLACSVVVHACYNFLLFSLMLIGTGGFRHLEKM